MVCRNFLNSIARWRLCSAADDLAGGDVKRGIQARGAGALVVVGRALGNAREHRQDRRGAIERLDLALLVHAQHDRSLGRVQVEADDVADLLDELRILGELPGLDGAAGARTPSRSGAPRTASSPTSAAIERVDQCVASFGVRLQRLDDHLLDLGVADLARLPRPRLVGQPIESMLDKPLPPLRDRVALIPETPGDLDVVRARRPQATRSATATPAPARSCAAASTTPTARAQQQTTRPATGTGEGMTHPPRCTRINASRHSCGSGRAWRPRPGAPAGRGRPRSSTPARPSVAMYRWPAAAGAVMARRCRSTTSRTSTMPNHRSGHAGRPPSSSRVIRLSEDVAPGASAGPKIARRVHRGQRPGPALGVDEVPGRPLGQRLRRDVGAHRAPPMRGPARLVERLVLRRVAVVDGPAGGGVDHPRHAGVAGRARPATRRRRRAG